jgi:hypothetical protein
LDADGACLTGVLDGLPVVVRTELRGGNTKSTWTVVAVDLVGAPSGLAVVGSGASVAVQDLDLGDPSFDPRFRVDAEGLGLAWLSAPARAELRSRSLHIVAGRLTVEWRGGLDASRIRRHVACAARLQVADPLEQLRSIAASDPSPRMRARAIGALHAEPGGAPAELLAEWADQPGVAGVFAATCLHRPLEVAALAALDDRDRYLVAQRLVRQGTPGDVVALVEALPTSTPRPVWFQVTEAAASRATPEVREAVARAVARLGGGAFVADRAAKVYSGTAPPPVTSAG